MSRRNLKVGVTLYVRQGQQSLWENGIFQNCFFLTQLLARSPAIESAFIVNGGDGDPAQAGDFLALAPVPVIDLATAMEQLDIVIELSAQLSPDWAREFRSRGGRVVGMRVANDYCIDIERTMFGKQHGMVISGTPYDVIWTLPAFEHTCADYYRSAHRAPVRVMQHLWSPMLVEQTLRAAGHTEFGYVAGRRKWRLAIMEPNLCMVKTSFVPMLVADLAHRADPRMIQYLRVYNTHGFINNPAFVNFARGLDLIRHGIGTFEGRFPVFQIMGNEADAIVAHHWENAQNYLYYEALYGGFPLIHNSDLIGQCGYRYRDFDCHDGAGALRRAFLEHDMRLDDYRRTAREFLDMLDPESDQNVLTYTQALLELEPRRTEYRA
ncbi:DUF2827 domain-containing protein [Burkholderia sp. Ac-20345]|uniref:DUF2827 domain-containing protein n=1 Tax=Burkholderia sp. Ac-20345 TaxID=2703891 RepID=UPI00197BFFC1|nr:DUF2827 domain-containing protein [Burkholderia sp. Ac-20345]MBN3778614.1 DUF2827 domain-containing protein [Burkholderia sp. Ac-20345]